MDQTKSVKLYRMVLMTSIVLNLAAGVFIMLWPDAFTTPLGQPEAFPDTWPRHWGWQLLAINALYMPGYWNPRCEPVAELVRNRHSPLVRAVLLQSG